MSPSIPVRFFFSALPTLSVVDAVCEAFSSFVCSLVCALLTGCSLPVIIFTPTIPMPLPIPTASSTITAVRLITPPFTVLIETFLGCNRGFFLFFISYIFNKHHFIFLPHENLWIPVRKNPRKLVFFWRLFFLGLTVDFN